MASAAARAAFASALVAVVLASAPEAYWQSVGDGYCQDDSCQDPTTCSHPWTTSSSCVGLEECKQACLAIEACVGIAWSATPTGDADCWDQSLPRCVVYGGDRAAPTRTASGDAAYACYARAEDTTSDGTTIAATGASAAAWKSDPKITAWFLAAFVFGSVAACAFLCTCLLHSEACRGNADCFEASLVSCRKTTPCCVGFLMALAAALALVADAESDQAGDPRLRLLMLSGALMAAGPGMLMAAGEANLKADPDWWGQSLCGRLLRSWPAACFLGSGACAVAWGAQRDDLTSHLAAAWLALLALAGCTATPLLNEEDTLQRCLPWWRWLPVACLLGFGACATAWGVQMADPLSWLCVASVMLLAPGISLVLYSMSSRFIKLGALSKSRDRVTDQVRHQGKTPRRIGGKTVTEWTTVFAWYPCGPCLICLSAACILSWSALGYDDTVAVGEACLAGVFAIVALLMLMHGTYWFINRPGDLANLEEAAEKIDGSITHLLQVGIIRLLSCEWLARQELPLHRRQDLPDEAFCTPDDAVRAHREGKVFVLSYGWLTSDHPDPHGLVLGHVRRFLVSSWARRYDPLSWALFWDFTGLPQKPRSDEEDSVFKAGLKDMGNLYGSLWRTVVLQLARLPEAPPECDVECCRPSPCAGTAHCPSSLLPKAATVPSLRSSTPAAACVYNTRPYFERGWCNFETGAAQLAAHNRTGNRSVDVLPKLIDISEEVPRPYDTSTAPKPTMEEVSDKVERAKFTGKGDKEAVKEMLKDFNGALAVGSRIAGAPSPSSRPRSGRAVAPDIVGRPVCLQDQWVSAAAEEATAQSSAADPCPNLLE